MKPPKIELKRHWPLLGIFGIMAIALISVLILVQLTIQEARDHRKSVEISTQTIVVLRDINRTAVDADSALRGYFISLDTNHLAPYKAAKERYRQDLQALEKLSDDSGNSGEIGIIQRIRNQADAHFATNDAIIKQIQDGDIFGAQKRLLLPESQAARHALKNASGDLERWKNIALKEAVTRSNSTEQAIIPLLALLAFTILLTLTLGLGLIVRHARATARANMADELAEARDRADLLAAELNHRVKNLYAIVLAVIQLSGRDAPEAKPVIQTIGDRIRALLNAHEVSLGTSSLSTSSFMQNESELEDLITTILAPHLPANDQQHIKGPSVKIRSELITPLGLLFHELVTNAVKYGGLSHIGSSLKVEWELSNAAQPEIILHWHEYKNTASASHAEAAQPIAASSFAAPEISPPPTDTAGFGSFLIQSTVRQLQGTINHDLHENGCRICIRFPLPSDSRSA